MRLLRSGRLPDAAAPGAVSASDGSIAAGAFSKIATGGSVIADPHLSPGTQTYLKAAVPGDGHGATVELTTVLLPPVRRPRAGPPNRPSRVFGRDDALATLEGAIAARVPIVVAGELGAGKTTLVDAALNGPAAGAVDDGIVQIPGALAGMVLTVDEIAQRLFDSLWDSSPNQRRIDAASAPSALVGCHPLLVLDGLHLGVDEQGAVARIVPGSAVVITSDALPLGGDGDFVVVGALPRADAARLLAERARIAGRCRRTSSTGRRRCCRTGRGPSPRSPTS